MNTKTRQAASGQGWAYFAAILGAVVSIAANVAHSYIPPAGATADWSPMAGAVISAIWWPVALAIVIELAVQVPWPRGWRWTLLRVVGLLPVAGVAAVVSYRHLAGLLRYYGEDVVTVTFGPIAVDGLMLMATAAIILTGKRSVSTTALVPISARLLPIIAPASILAPAVVTPRPVPIIVPAGARMLPLVASVSAQDAASVPETTPEPDNDAGGDSRGALHILPRPSGGRPAIETRKLFEALKTQNPKLTQAAAAEKLGISRWALRDALAATAEAN